MSCIIFRLAKQLTPGADSDSNLVKIEGTMALCGELGIDPENVSNQKVDQAE